VRVKFFSHQSHPKRRATCQQDAFSPQFSNPPGSSSSPASWRASRTSARSSSGIAELLTVEEPVLPVCPGHRQEHRQEHLRDRVLLCLLHRRRQAHQEWRASFADNFKRHLVTFKIKDFRRAFYMYMFTAIFPLVRTPEERTVFMCVCSSTFCPAFLPIS
jgi:hypothetical protein